MADDARRRALQAYSSGRMTALELRRRLGDASYGDILLFLSEEDLPLPHAPVEGREEQIERARAWLFPDRGP